jgi:CP family cyanate transporter-like MFS transporter
MQVARRTIAAQKMSPPANSAAGRSVGRDLALLCVLWFAGVALRMTILAIPPVIPLIHDELRMSETQVGLLIGLPLAIFAIAAVPGSLLIARIGTRLAVILGIVVTALAGGARAAAVDIWTLYAAAIATGLGVAIMQPGLPTLVREWMPARIAMGTVVYTSGMLLGATFPPVLTIPFVLPLVGGSWRLDLLIWAVPALLVAPVFYLFSPRTHDHRHVVTAIGGRWWPDWKNPLIWLLGLTFGSNNSTYFATNAFLGDYLASQGRPDLLGSALGWLNGSQIFALMVLFATAKHLERRVWPFLLLGPLLLVSFLGIILIPTPLGVILSAAGVGFTTAITLTATLALPPILSAPGDVPRNAAGMFTISYSCAVVIPTISGALWDLTGKPWTAFVPLCVCAVTLTVLGVMLVRYPPAVEALPGR